MCSPGLVYPPGQEGPFQGEDIENSDQEDYLAGFDCIDPDRLASATHTRTSDLKNDESAIQKKHRKILPRYQQTFDVDDFSPINREARRALLNLLHHKETLTEECCETYSRQQRSLPLGTAYGASDQFLPQAQKAVRLAHFLSAFQQAQLPPEPRRRGRRHSPTDDPPLHVDLLFGEVVAAVMSDRRIIASGIFYDQGRYIDQDGQESELFGPYAYKSTPDDIETVQAVDKVADEPPYTSEPWFQDLRDIWIASTEGLESYRQRPIIRSDVAGSDVKEHHYYPIDYHAATIQDGIWTEPFYPCDDRVNDFVLVYSVPFFGVYDVSFEVEFRLKLCLSKLDLSQDYLVFYDILCVWRS